MGGPAVARIDQEALDPADLTVDGMDPLAGTHVRLAHRHKVLDDHWRLSRAGVISHTDEAAADAVHASDQLALRGVFEPVELRESAVHADLTAGAVHQIDRHQPAGLPMVFRRNDKMSDRAGGRVDDQTADLAARTIRAVCLSSNGEFRRLCR